MSLADGKIDEQALEKFLKDYRTDACKQVRGIYLDLPILQDIYFGAMYLDMCDNEEKYKSIKDALPRYNARLTQTHVEYFDWYTKDENALLSYMKDKSHVSSIMHTSPFTTFAIELGMMHKDALEENAATVSVDVDAVRCIHYYINTYPLELTKEEMVELKFRLTHILNDNEVTLSVLSMPWYELDTKYYNKINKWFFYDFYEVMKHPDSPFAIEMFRNLRFRDNEVCAEPRIVAEDLVPKIHTLSSDDLSKIERSMHIFMSALADFKSHRSLLIMDK